MANRVAHLDLALHAGEELNIEKSERLVIEDALIFVENVIDAFLATLSIHPRSSQHRHSIMERILGHIRPDDREGLVTALDCYRFIGEIMSESDTTPLAVTHARGAARVAQLATQSFPSPWSARAPAT